MQNRSRRFLVARAAAALAGLALAASAMPAFAQGYPARPITLIVPYAAGGSIDLVARILAEGLTARLGQTVTIDLRIDGRSAYLWSEDMRAVPRVRRWADNYMVVARPAGPVWPWCGFPVRARARP